MDDGLLMTMDPEKALSGPLAASYVERINGILEREMKATVEFITEHRDVVQQLGEALLSTDKFGYLLPFEAVSVLLLACIIGGVVIARKR